MGLVEILIFLMLASLGVSIVGIFKAFAVLVILNYAHSKFSIRVNNLITSLILIKTTSLVLPVLVIASITNFSIHLSLWFTIVTAFIYLLLTIISVTVLWLQSKDIIEFINEE
jgi:hypothetical protein